MREASSGRIASIKERSAREIYKYVKEHSTVVKILDEPCSRGRNLKAKVIVAVETMEAAQTRIGGIDAMSAQASMKIAKHPLASQKKPAIRYHSSVMRLRDPVVRLSVRDAETVYRTALNNVMNILYRSAVPDDDAYMIGADAATTVRFIRNLESNYEAGIIDLSSKEIVRLSRSSGRSCRVQALAAGRAYAVQVNVGDLLVLVYEHPGQVQVVPAPKRKRRTDTARFVIIEQCGTWTLGRYLTMDK